MSRRKNFPILASCVAIAVLLLTASVAPAAEPVRDKKKQDIEGPAKNVVKATAEVNPKVQPGKDNWHASFANACEAAKKSGKPVFLFQMMGKLDDQFC